MPQPPKHWGVGLCFIRRTRNMHLIDDVTVVMGISLTLSRDDFNSPKKSNSLDKGSVVQKPRFGSYAIKKKRENNANRKHTKREQDDLTWFGLKPTSMGENG